jgi:hypothetical protein
MHRALCGGTTCLMVEREDEPRHEVCVLRGEQVRHQDRLPFRASPHMQSQTWRAALTQGAPAHP